MRPPITPPKMGPNFLEGAGDGVVVGDRDGEGDGVGSDGSFCMSMPARSTLNAFVWVSSERFLPEDLVPGVQGTV